MANKHRNCQPLGTSEVAAYMTRKGFPVQENTVRQWRSRGVMDDPDWILGGRPIWRMGAIDSFMRRTGRDREGYLKRVSMGLATIDELQGVTELPPGTTLVCERCERQVDPWPLERGDKCSPGNWTHCIRNDGLYGQSTLPVSDEPESDGDAA